MASFDVRLDPVTNDLPEVSSFVTGPELTTQRAGVRLRTFGPSVEGVSGEWILDQFVGLPFLDWRQQKPPDLANVTAVLTAEIASTPGVIRVESINTTFDPVTRTITAVGTAIIEGNEDVDELSVAFAVTIGRNTTPVLVTFYSSGAVT